MFRKKTDGRRPTSCAFAKETRVRSHDRRARRQPDDHARYAGVAGGQSLRRPTGGGLLLRSEPCNNAAPRHPLCPSRQRWPDLRPVGQGPSGRVRPRCVRRVSTPPPTRVLVILPAGMPVAKSRPVAVTSMTVEPLSLPIAVLGASATTPPVLRHGSGSSCPVAHSSPCGCPCQPTHPRAGRTRAP